MLPLSSPDCSFPGSSCFDENAMSPHNLKKNFSAKASACEERPRGLEATSRQVGGQK